MKLAALLVALLALFSVPIASAQTPHRSVAVRTGTVSGVVVALDGHKPIPQALVTLSSQVRGAPTVQRTMRTDDQGAFAFTGVPDDFNWISVEKEGFLCPVGHGLPAKCQTSAHPGRLLALTMLPEATITGQVVDQEGKPIPNLELDLIRRGADGEDGLYYWMTEHLRDLRTDADGVFRISKLEPGVYALHVPAAYDPPMWERDEKGSSQFHLPHFGYADTYYPGVLDWKKAEPLIVRAGGAITANFTVRSAPIQAVTLHYRGDFRAESFSVSDSTGSAALYEDAVSRPGSVRILAPPGDYKARLTLYAAGNPDRSVPPHFVSMPFTVRNRPVVINNVPVQPWVKIDLPVHVRVELAGSKDFPQAPYIAPAGISLELQADGDGLGGFGPTLRLDQVAAKPESHVEFKGVTPGRYIFRLSGDGVYLASLRCGSLDLLRKPLVLRSGIPPCTVEAVLRDDFASIAVGLGPAAQATLGDLQSAAFALIPLDEPCEYPVFGAVYKLGRRPEPRKHQIPPGTYAAVLFYGRHLAWREPGFRKRLARLGTRVTLAPGESVTLPLNFSPAFNFWSLGFGDVP